MRYAAAPTYEQRVRQWHWWFAWRPVTTISGYRVWFEWVKRRRVGFLVGNWGEWEYTAVTN